MSSYVTTSLQPSGNRVAPRECMGTLGASGPILFSESQSSRTSWVVGSFNSAHFLAVDQNGQAKQYSFDETVFNATLEETLLSTRPLVASGNPLQPIVSPDSCSQLSSPIPTTLDGSNLLWIDSDQHLKSYVVVNGTKDVEIDVNRTILEPLIDGHITFSSANQLWALYTHATRTRYVHGILGDSTEGYHLHVLAKKEENNNSGFQVTSEIVLDGDDMVFEGLAPMWTDVDEDGVDDLLTTISSGGIGAALRVYFINADGTVRDQAESEFIGRGGRWLHQLASGPLGPNGELEIVEIRTPHIGGIVRYYRYNADEGVLENVAQASNSFYTSHNIGSRNIDQAIVADFNGDGVFELVVQNQAKTELHALQRTTSSSSVESVWSVSLPAPIFSNIALSCPNNNTGTGTPQLLFGTDDSKLVRIVFSQETFDTAPTPSAAFSFSPSLSAGGAFVTSFAPSLSPSALWSMLPSSMPMRTSTTSLSFSPSTTTTSSLPPSFPPIDPTDTDGGGGGGGGGGGPARLPTWMYSTMLLMWLLKRN